MDLLAALRRSPTTRGHDSNHKLRKRLIRFLEAPIRKRRKLFENLKPVLLTFQDHGLRGLIAEGVLEPYQSRTKPACEPLRAPKASEKGSKAPRAPGTASGSPVVAAAGSTDEPAPRRTTSMKLLSSDAPVESFSPPKKTCWKRLYSGRSVLVDEDGNVLGDDREGQEPQPMQPCPGPGYDPTYAERKRKWCRSKLEH